MEYKCPACGGALEFDSSLQKMKCPYCDSVYEMEELKQKDEVLNGHAQPDNKWEDGETDSMSVFTCQSCGGEIIGDENTGATSCPFCGNPVVMTGRFKGELKPDFVIPFKLDKKAAKEKYLKHIEGKFLLPKTFKDKNHIDEIKGVYVPFWLFDSDVSAAASFLGETVRVWSDKRFRYTESAYYNVYREGTMSFRNIPADGSSKMDDTLMESIEPFDFSEAVPFQTAYLAGYFADKYDVDAKSSEGRANERIRNSAIELLKDSDTEKYNSIKNAEDIGIENIFAGVEGVDHTVVPNTINIKDGKVKYALYPVWLLSTTYNGEKFTFAMNGQTGRFVGDLPIDKKLKNKLFAGIFAGVSVIATVLSYFLFG